MESRWFVRPGQKLEETNISDRQRALHITSNAWSSIKFHLHKKRLKAEALEKERARKKAIKAESQAMVNSWPDSVMVPILLTEKLLISTNELILESISTQK